MNMISIGVDQSTTATGLCAVRFDKSGEWEVVTAKTVETETYNEMSTELRAFINFVSYHDMPPPTVIMCEGAYFGKSASAHANAVRSAAWVEAVVCQYKLGEMFDVVPAASWRAVAWHRLKNASRLKSADAKKYSIIFADEAGIVDPDDHQGDALGLAIYGMKAYLEREDRNEK